MKVLTKLLITFVSYEITTGLYAYCTRSDIAKRGGSIPYARGRIPGINHVITVAMNIHRIHDFISDKFEENGGHPFYLSVRLGWRNGAVFLCSPAHFKDVMKTQFHAFDKGPRLHDALLDVLGRGIFTQDGMSWRHQRKVASNIFTMRQLRESMAKTSQKWLVRLNSIFGRHCETGESLDLFTQMQRFTFSAFAEMGLGVEMNCLDVKVEHPFQAAFDRAQHTMAIRFILPPIAWKTLRFLRFGWERQHQKDIELINREVMQIISKSLEHRRLQKDDKLDIEQDIVSLFLGSMNDSGINVDPKYLRDIVVNFLLAGRDTTAQTLTWFFYLINLNPQVETRIRTELRERVPKVMLNSIESPSMEDVSGLIYLEAALLETLRLYPPVPLNHKHTNRDVLLSDGTFIKANTGIFIPSYSIGRMKSVWGEDAKKFIPERWVDQTTGKLVSVPTWKFPAFHGGSRACLGQRLAMMQMKIVIASLVSKFQVRIIPGQEIRPDLSLTLPVKNGMKVKIYRGIAPKG